MATVQIYFGSQSGTSECFAEELCEEASSNSVSAEVLDLAAFTPESFKAHGVVLLVVSTYGEGEPSDNAFKFHKWVTDPRNDGALKGQRFAVMGLGDMNYSQFNNMGMQTDESLERMGGKRVYRRGVGDDSQDIAADFKQWKEGGLWAALRQACAEALAEAPELAPGAVAQQAQKVMIIPTEFTLFYGADEDGAAKEICDAVAAEMKAQKLCIAGTHDLADRKSVGHVGKLPKKSVAIVLVDAGPEGLCAPARKLLRNMSLEFDAGSLVDKKLSYAMLAIASSKCNNSAVSLKDGNKKSAEGIPKAFERVGAIAVEGPTYVDAGVEAVEPIVKELVASLKKVADAAAGDTHADPNGSAVNGQAVAAAPAAKVKFLCAGEEAKEAGDALIDAWTGGEVSTEDASLAALAACAQAKTQAILVIECAADGSLSDGARGFMTQLNAAPLPIKAQLKSLKFALLAVAATDFGNAAERASVKGAMTELTAAVAPFAMTLARIGSKCVGSAAINLQDADLASGDGLKTVCSTLQDKFKETAPGSAPTPTNGAVAAARPPAAAAGPAKLGVLRMAPNQAALPAEPAGEASDVLARFFFEAEKAKVTKVRELRQKPQHAEGFATVEVELEAIGSLKGYGLGGTLSLLPQSDTADVEAAVQLMGLKKDDVNRWITFTSPEGGRVKKPFPTPCTLGDALTKYCDLAHAPSKKMLSALLPTLQSAEVKGHIEKLLADSEALKLLQGGKDCCRMHEFWAMMGVTTMSPGDFLVHCPRQKAREFTIASSPKATPNSITLCVSLTSHEVPADLSELCTALQKAGCLPAAAVPPSNRGRFFGACSQWMSTQLRSGATVLAKTRPSALHLPSKDVPVIMVGAGAGVAPFRGFWEELRRGTQKAPAALFFGCRHPDQDWLYKEEMSASVKLTAGCGALARMQVGPKRPLAALFTAFSRPGEGQQGKYVQDDVRKQAQSIKHWMDKMDGCFYLCGSSAMGNGVLEALAEILEGGRERVDALRKEGRIVAEMWG